MISDAAGNVVTTFPSEGWGISWSPDSTRVAVWVRWGQDTSSDGTLPGDVKPRTIGVYGLDGVRQTLLTDMPPWGEGDPVWSADGESLLLGLNWEIPLDGSAPRKLPWADRRAAWATPSPDGSQVAYTAHRSLFVAEADGSNPQRVFGHFAAWTLWSPTGDRIAFVSFDSIPFNSHGRLRVLDVATGTVTLLAEAKSEHLTVIEFSPEGDRILFTRTEDGDSISSLWSVNTDGSDLRRLVTGTNGGDWFSPNRAQREG